MTKEKGSRKNIFLRLTALGLSIIFIGAMSLFVLFMVVTSGVTLNTNALALSNDSQVTLLDGKDVSFDIRKPEISMMASTVSAHRFVREKMAEIQRNIARSMDCILDGREIGSYVLPNANFKYYITADSKVRAERRYKELLERGEKVDFDKLHEEIIQRDYNDSHREFAPLKRVPDAKFIDTSDLTADEVVEIIVNDVRRGKTNV